MVENLIDFSLIPFVELKLAHFLYEKNFLWVNRLPVVVKEIILSIKQDKIER